MTLILSQICDELKKTTQPSVLWAIPFICNDSMYHRQISAREISSTQKVIKVLYVQGMDYEMTTINLGGTVIHFIDLHHLDNFCEGLAPCHLAGAT